MKRLKSIRVIEPFDLYDITVEREHCFELFNGIIAHNSLFPKDIVGGGCVDGSTHIIMEDGSTKNMSEIIVGDKVITLDGPREVTHTWTPNTLEEGYPERYEVEFDDHVKVVVSKSHRFLTKNGWKFITDITQSDEIVSAL